MSLRDRIFNFRQFKDEPKPFLDHLEELRHTIIKMGVALVGMMMLSFCLRSWLFAVVQRPLHAIDAKAFDNLQSLGVVDSFSI
jgi:sec-independent protein translocase protein TatC